MRAPRLGRASPKLPPEPTYWNSRDHGSRLSPALKPASPARPGPRDPHGSPAVRPRRWATRSPAEARLSPYREGPARRGGGAGQWTRSRRVPALHAGARRCLRDRRERGKEEPRGSRSQPRAFTHQPSPLDVGRGWTSSPSAIAVDVHVTLPKSGPGAGTDS